MATIADVSKLNTPGFKTSFGKSGKSRIVAKNMAFTKNTSLFKNIKVGGKWGTQNLAKADYLNARFGLNAGIGEPSRMSGHYGMGGIGKFGSVAANYNIQNLSKAQVAGDVVGKGISIAMGILNKTGVLDFGDSTVTKQGASSKLDSAMGNIPTATTLSSASASAALNAMNQATNAGDLSVAIENAEKEYSSMSAQDGPLKEKADAAQNNMQKLQDTVGQEEANVQNATKAVSDGEQKITGLNSQLQKLDAGYANACQNVETKQSLFDKADSSLTSAESELSQAEGLPADDPSRAAKISAAQEKVKSAKDAKQKAETELNKAKEEKNKAFDALGDKKTEIQKAEEELSNAKEEVKNAKSKLDSSKEKLEKAKKDLEDAKGAIKEYQNNAKDMVALQSAITSNKARLEKLKASEQKEMQSLNGKIQNDESQNSELSSKIDNGDGYSKSELRSMRKIDKNNAQNEERRTRMAELANSQLKLQTPIKGTDGNDYRTVTIGSETYYSRNNQMISEDEYKQNVSS